MLMNIWLRQGETRGWENAPAEQSASYTGAGWTSEGQKYRLFTHLPTARITCNFFYIKIFTFCLLGWFFFLLLSLLLLKRINNQVVEILDQGSYLAAFSTLCTGWQIDPEIPFWCLSPAQAAPGTPAVPPCLGSEIELCYPSNSVHVTGKGSAPILKPWQKYKKLTGVFSPRAACQKHQLRCKTTRWQFSSPGLNV